MSFNTVMNTILPSLNGASGHIIGPYGEKRDKKPPHGGVDFNYVGGQTGNNLTHPTIYSPVNGIVVGGPGQYGTISIMDMYGNRHEILHTNSQLVKIGDWVSVGDPIGTMGGKGPEGPNQYPQHVHYQIHDANGKLMNPQGWWDSSPETPLDSFNILDKLSSESLLSDTIKRILNDIEKAATTRSPLILDLDGDGVETLGKNSGVHFDHDGNGFAELSGWVSEDDGLLVRDINNNGKIDDGTELFGDNTRLSNGKKAANGFAALADMDSNGDGMINAQDLAFNDLKVWKDEDSDGQVDEGELLTLEQADIQSINVNYRNADIKEDNGNIHKQQGNYQTNNGATAALTDVWFATDLARTVEKDLVAVADDIRALPNMDGFGNVHSLHQAMARDTSGALRTLIEGFIAETDPTKQSTLITDIIYAWAGVSHIDPASRAASQIYGNSIGDARKLEALEEFLGQEWSGTWCWGSRLCLLQLQDRDHRHHRQ